MGRDIHRLKMKKPAVKRVFSTIARSGPSTCHQALPKLVFESASNASSFFGTQESVIQVKLVTLADKIAVGRQTPSANLAARRADAAAEGVRVETADGFATRVLGQTARLRAPWAAVAAGRLASKEPAAQDERSA